MNGGSKTKKIINGKKYDTETAEKVGRRCSGSSTSDFSYWCQTLYRKRTGEFFLYGEGGPMTGYARSCGDNNWGWGDEIIPLTKKKAKQWAEWNLDGDEYEAIFGEVEE